MQKDKQADIEVVDAENIVASDDSPAPNDEFAGVSKPRSRIGLWLIILFNLLCTLGLGGAGAWYYLEQAKISYKTELADLQQHVAQLSAHDAHQQQLHADHQRNMQQKLQTLDDALAEQQLNRDNIAQLKTDLALQQQILNAINGALASVTAERPSDWIYAEANYLVNLAGRKLYLERDLATAQALLETADQRLASLNDSALLPLRALIAQDIQHLKQLPKVAVDELSLQLNGLLAQVANLPLDTIALPDPVDDKHDQNLTANIDDWQANLKKTWSALLDDFISVEKRQAAVQPFMSGQSQWLARAQLKYALLAAQHALLNQQAAIYQTNLQTALVLIEQHYQVDSPDVSVFTESVEALLAQGIIQALPPQIDSQIPLNRLVNERQLAPINSDAMPAEPAAEVTVEAESTPSEEAVEGGE